MPLRDHFHAPVADLASWEELHGAWPGVMAFRLNAILPSGFRSGVRVRVGGLVEVDVGTFEHEETAKRGREADEASPATALAPPTVLLETDAPTPPEYEVFVYDERQGRRLVAAIELVSPRNKDRTESRDAFVSKCHAFLQQEVCVAIVDPVTDRSGNLYAELASRIGAKRPGVADVSIYAVSCRARGVGGRYRVEAWEHPLQVGAPLPTLPLWITESRDVPLELERTYEETCYGLRII